MTQPSNILMGSLENFLSTKYGLCKILAQRYNTSVLNFSYSAPSMQRISINVPGRAQCRRRRSRIVPQRGTGRPFKSSAAFRRQPMPAEGPYGFDSPPLRSTAASRGDRSRRASTTAGSRGRDDSSRLQRLTARARDPRPCDGGRPEASPPLSRRNRSPVEFDPVEFSWDEETFPVEFDPIEFSEDDEELQEFDPEEFKDETGESEDKEAPPPAARINHSPVEFGPMEIKDETGESEDKEAPLPRCRLGRTSNSGTADEEERVHSGGSHPTAIARHGVGPPADLDQVRRDPSMDEMDEEFRQALAASLAEAQVASTDIDADLEEQFRAAMEASMFDAEEQIRRIIEASQREHEEEERRKARRRQQYEELQVLLGASQRIVSESGIQDDQDELAMVLSLSEAAYAEDVHRRAARMAHERTSSPQTASWTETSQANQQRGPPGVALPPVIPTSPAEGTAQRATTTTPIRNPSQCARDNSSPSQHPNGKNALIESNKAVIPTDKATSSQALIVRPPPIDPPALIALCEKAFPEDVDISDALAASRRTATISSIQNADLDFDPILASTIAESLAWAQANAADATDIGLAEPPPSYHFSIDEEESRQIDHFRYTTADYRRERPAGRKPITSPIRTIMRLWREFLAWEAEYGVADANGRRKASPFGPLPPPSSSSTDDEQQQQQQQQQLAPPPPPPPEIASRLDATHRPPLRSDLAIARPTDQTSRFMSASLTPERRASALRMQAQSRAISQSGLAGHRPRRPPEAHMEPFGRLPIVREELPPVAAAGGREGGKRRRRGI